MTANWPFNPRKVVKREIGKTVLVKVGTESCGCSTYRVATGKHSQLIGTGDFLTVHRKECTADHLA